jgi:fluoride exporter
VTARVRWMVLAGGTIGTAGRALAGVSAPGAFPWPTLVVNLIGTVALGFLIGRVGAKPDTSRWVPLIGVGVMGSLTTFGTMMVELVDLAERGATTAAVSYGFVSLGAGLGLGVVGLRVGEAKR